MVSKAGQRTHTLALQTFGKQHYRHPAPTDGEISGSDTMHQCDDRIMVCGAFWVQKNDCVTGALPF
jgi:hypothetical protein